MPRYSAKKDRQNLRRVADLDLATAGLNAYAKVHEDDPDSLTPEMKDQIRRWGRERQVLAGQLLARRWPAAPGITSQRVTEHQKAMAAQRERDAGKKRKAA